MVLNTPCTDASPPLSCSPCSTPHSWLPSPRSHSQFYVISTSELSTLLDATVMTPQSPQTKLCRLNTTFTEVHRVEVAETLSGINQSLTRHSSQYGIANILFCNHADNPTLEVLAVVTAVDVLDELHRELHHDLHHELHHELQNCSVFSYIQCSEYLVWQMLRVSQSLCQTKPYFD